MSDNETEYDPYPDTARILYNLLIMRDPAECFITMETLDPDQMGDVISCLLGAVDLMFGQFMTADARMDFSELLWHYMTGNNMCEECRELKDGD